jgi:GcrA cell cycle regulator
MTTATRAQTKWTAEMETSLRDLWSDGFSANLIGAQMGLTKCQIVGKATRLSLPPRKIIHGRPVGRKPAAKKPRTVFRFNGTARKKPEYSFAPILSPDDTRRCDLMGLREISCRYVVAQEPSMFCGHNKQSGSSYCPFHHGVVWIKPSMVKAMKGAA